MKVLFITEPDFLRNHVGVRRVILHYIDQLQHEGHEVRLGCQTSRGLVGGRLNRSTKPARMRQFRPYWSSRTNREALIRIDGVNETFLDSEWLAERVDPDDFDLCVITNPWLCAKGLRPIRGAIGIAYDLIPNLLALGGLHFHHHVEIYRFAHEHDLGFRYFIENCSRVSCISQSTKDDFLRLYPDALKIPDVLVDIPFPTTQLWEPDSQVDPSILVVNALDWRKNFKGICRILRNASRIERRLRVDLVGNERLPKPDVIAMLEELADAGLHVNWFRDAHEALLQNLYRTSSVLLFPSFYEGLGLPILEAQAAGLPAISGSNSSCREINMNHSLMFDVTDEDGMTAALLSLASGNGASIEHLRGQALVEAQRRFLSENSRGLLAPNHKTNQHR